MAIDFLIVFIIILSISLEIREGFLHSLQNLLTAFGSILIGIIAYQIIFRLFQSFIIGIISFIIATSGFLLLSHLLLRGRRKRGRQTKFSFASIGGALCGFFLGIGASLATLIILSFLFPNEIEESKLSNKILNILPYVYHLADIVDLKFPMLKNFYQEEWEDWEIQFRERINFSHLDKSTCIQCGNQVKFKGYFRRRGILVSPLFVCKVCGRRSDGCQTFEGFHELYGKCPIDIAKRCVLLDCGVWPNKKGVTPYGICPVCGKKFPSQ